MSGFTRLTRIIAAVFFFLQVSYAENHEWTYTHSRHQQNWPFEVCMTGKQQSPVKLETKINCSAPLAPKFLDDKKLTLPLKLQAINNGHSLMFKAVQDDLLETVRVLVPNHFNDELTTYHLQSFHFHWKGTDDALQGSEHSIDGKFYDAEMHLVFIDRNEEQYAVLGFPINAVRKEANPHFDKLFNIGLNTLHEEDEGRLLSEEVTLFELIGNIDRTQFFRYRGSLTTPPCTETVTWTVFTEIITISPSQLAALRSLPHVGNLNNYRAPFRPVPLHKLRRSC